MYQLFLKKLHQSGIMLFYKYVKCFSHQETKKKKRTTWYSLLKKEKCWFPWGNLLHSTSMLECQQPTYEKRFNIIHTNPPIFITSSLLTSLIPGLLTFTKIISGSNCSLSLCHQSHRFYSSICLAARTEQRSSPQLQGRQMKDARIIVICKTQFTDILYQKGEKKAQFHFNYGEPQE